MKENIILDLSECYPNKKASTLISSIVSSQIVTNGKNVYQLPYLSIAETVKYKPNRLKVITGLQTCRESFSHSLGSYFYAESKLLDAKPTTGYAISPTIKKIRILLIPRLINPLLIRTFEKGKPSVCSFSVSKEEEKIGNELNGISKKIGIVNNILHIFEDEVGFKRSVVSKCSWDDLVNLKEFIGTRVIRKKDDIYSIDSVVDAIKMLPVYAFDADKKFLSTPHALSLYTLLIRALFCTNKYDMFENITDIKSLKNAFEKFAYSSASSDRVFFQQHGLWFEFCKNMKKIYNTFDPAKTYPFPRFTTDGITNLCNGTTINTDINKRFISIKNKMNKKSLAK